MVKINFKAKKKKTYFLNAITFNLSRLSPFRSKRVWVFGAWTGRKFDDNSRWLFEYVNKKNELGIEAIWLSPYQSVVDEVKREGYVAYRSGSLKGLWTQLRAGLAVYTNSLMDFSVFPLFGGAEILTTFHGMSFKKVYNTKYSGWQLHTKRFLDHIFSWTYRTFTTVTSVHAKKWMMDSFTLKPEDIYITGMPRNDILKSVNRQAVLADAEIRDDKQIIFYFPTYRNATMGKDAVKKIVEELYNDKYLDEVLNQTNSILVVKTHPLTQPFRLAERDNFKVLDFQSVKNNQEFLGAGDILITDYSSCFVDFALLNRPIIFYLPDNNRFLSLSEEMDDMFFEICDLNKAINPSELAKKILRPSSGVCQVTNDIWEDKSISGTNYTENVYKLILNKIGILNTNSSKGI